MVKFSCVVNQCCRYLAKTNKAHYEVLRQILSILLELHIWCLRGVPQQYWRKVFKLFQIYSYADTAGLLLVRPYFLRGKNFREVKWIVDSWSTDSEPFEWCQAYLTPKNYSKNFRHHFYFTFHFEGNIKPYTSSFSHRLKSVIVDAHDHNRNRSSMSTRWVNSSTRRYFYCKMLIKFC